MVFSGGLVLGLHTLMSLLSPHEAGTIKGPDSTTRADDRSYHLTLGMPSMMVGSLSSQPADHMGSYGPAFYQSYGASGQFAYEFDGEQLFSVELKKREAVWRLPEFGNFAYFDPQNGLASIAAIKAHLDVLVERSNRTRATNVPPRVTVLPKFRVELGQPNILICMVDNIFPPVINITWLRNGQIITEGVAQTSFYSQPDHLFRKFYYLTFVPSADDMYDCKVEHWGLDEPLFRHWEPQVLVPLPDTIETLVCALGLALGLVGFLVGTILIIRGTCLSSAPR